MAQRPRRRFLDPLRCLLVAAMAMLAWSASAAAQITEFPVPTANSLPSGITAGPDGALWFTEASGNNIGRITTAGAVTEFPLATASSTPFSITAGSDGALWFTANGTCPGRLSGQNPVPAYAGRITMAGAVSTFPVSALCNTVVGTFSSQISITPGPDGALWFIEVIPPGANGSSFIERLTTAGANTTYPPSPGITGGVSGIAAGPDGAMWFTEFNNGKIGRITTAGTITNEFPLPAPSGEPNGIVTGPDGALWFAEPGFSRVGRIDTSGNFSFFNLPNNGSRPTAITAGADGALWFLEPNLNLVGRITTSGAITEYTVPTASSGLTAITAGPNGTIWFTEGTANKIGMVTPAILTVSETGAGSGLVTSTPAGINCSPSSNQCAASFATGSQVTLFATALAGSSFTGWSGGGCSGNVAPCTVTLGAATTVTANFATLPSFMLSVAKAGTGSGTVTSNPSGINCGPTCNASFSSGTQVALTATAASGSTFAGWSGGCSGVTCSVTVTANTSATATFVQNSTTNIALQAAVLPLSRSVQVGAPATAFATILNTGPGTASTCSIAPATSVPANFAFQTTNPSTNALTGTPNTPADIAQGAGQSFVIAFTPTAAFAPTNVLLTFACANAAPAPSIVGIDTLNLSASSSPTPDIVALAASGDPGYVDIPGPTGTGVFAVATVNLGSVAQITGSANTGSANLPVTLLICQTNPSTGVCLASPAVNVTTTIAANATPTFGIFVTGSAPVPNLPGVNRAFVTFVDANGVLRGETSVAVRTQ